MTERTNWTTRLAGVPDWALREELQRRGEEADTDQAVHLPGLTVDPVAGQVVWRGERHRVGGRAMEIVYALALAHQQGRRRVRSDLLAARVFRGWDQAAARASVNVTLSNLHDRLPGLAVTERLRGAGPYSYRRLALDEEASAGAERVA